MYNGAILIGAGETRAADTFHAINPTTGANRDVGFSNAGPHEVAKACALAADAFAAFSTTSLEARATFIETVADNILALKDDLVATGNAETALPVARLQGETGRTVGQLKMFATEVRAGLWLDATIDPAMPDRTPLPRADLRRVNVALGPVAVFGASNFPLAFSVAGGDTAAALAAGCPVVAKAHPAHPGTSELVGRAVQKAVKDCGLPAGTFSLLFEGGRDIGQGLVADPRIAAVGFTGSRAGGTALMKIAAERPIPIPVYAEMSSINPVILFPGALQARGATIGKDFVTSLTLGAGQFCTNPGLILAVEGEGLDSFVSAAKAALAETAAATMLTPGIHKAYRAGVAALEGHVEVETLARGRAGEAMQGQAALFSTTAEAFLKHHELCDEVFGASALLVRCRDEAQLRAVLQSLEGQLTASLHMVEADYPAARTLLPLLETKVGRILVNGFGTGVEVSHAMVHGGPYPATSDGRTTSVGSLAIERFMRPVSYQDMPEALLPEALKDGNPLKLTRRIDGKLQTP